MVNRDNWKAYKRYLAYLADVRQLDRLTVDKYRKELSYLLDWADEKPLTSAPAIRPAFPRYVASADGNHDGQPLTAAYARRVCAAARTFLTWLRMTEGSAYRDLSERWLETLTMQRQHQGKITEHEFYTADEVRKLVSVPAESLLTRRDQAAAAFLFLSGMRIGAFVTMTLKCVDVGKRRVKQWPDLGVMTKNRKAGTTYLLDVPDLLEVVKAWDLFLRERSADDGLWYPILSRDGGKIVAGKPADPTRAKSFYQGLQRLCAVAGVPFKSPHKMRHGHTMHALAGAETIADLKAISQNLMHASVTITDQVYGVLSGDTVGERIAALGQGNGTTSPSPGSAELGKEDMKRLMREVLQEMRQ